MLKALVIIIAVVFVLFIAGLLYRYRKAFNFLRIALGIKHNQDPHSNSEVAIYDLDAAPGVRVVPEWEHALGILVGYPFQLPLAMLREAAKDALLFITVNSLRRQRRCTEKLRRHGVNLDNTRFITTKQHIGYYGTRDWGPYTVIDNGTVSLADANYHDYPFSGYDSGGKIDWLTDSIPLFTLTYENAAPAEVAQLLHAERRELKIALTGGAVMFDGKGTLLVNQLVIDENRSMGVSFEELKRILAKSLGVRRLIVLPNYEGWGVQHIDCLLKLLDEKRILVKQLDSNHPDYERVETIARELAKVDGPDGEPYEILRLRTPSYAPGMAAPYTNSLIFNNKVFVPNLDIPGDVGALETWKKAMPDHEVFGFARDRGMHNWTYTDSLHCRTKALFVPYGG
jgi:agmatine/peptidylarginine deiminase